jgi:tetratricopeptide (TPR) repeat protein
MASRSWSLLFTLAVAIGLLWVALVGAQGDRSELIAFSLREAQRALQKSGLSRTELNAAGGMGELVGLIVDQQGQDLVLLGRKVEGARLFSLDDLVFLMRAAQQRGLSGPGVSLEPKRDDIHSGVLEVRFFGGAANTGMGQVCFDSDYLMKKMALGDVPTGVAGIRNYAQLTADWTNREGPRSWNVLSRFWFTPIYAPVAATPTKDIFLLKEVKVRAQVQTLFAEINGKPAGAGFKDQPAETYADAFTDHFDEVAQKHHVYADLTRVMGALKLMETLFITATPEVLDFWLHTYRPTPAKSLPAVPLLRKEMTAGQRKIAIVGGVRIAGLTLQLRRKELAAVKEAVLLARPSPESITWVVGWDRDWRVYAPGLSARDQKIALLFADALLQHEKGEDMAAVQSLDRVLKAYPEVVEAKFLKAVYSRDLAIKQGKVNQVEQPLAALNQLVREHPCLLEARYELGVTWRVLGRTDKAVTELQRVVRARPDFAMAHQALGLAYATEGNQTASITHLQEYLRLETGKDNRWIQEAKRRLDSLRSLPGGPAKEVRFEKFSEALYAFQCNYPQGWRVLKGEAIKQLFPNMAAARNIAVAFADPRKSDSNVNIQIIPYPGKTLSEREISDKLPKLDALYKARLKNFQKVAAGPVDVSGVKAISYMLKNDRAGVMIQQCIITLVKDRKAYTITFTAQELDFQNLWNTYFKQILASLKVGNT